MDIPDLASVASHLVRHLVPGQIDEDDLACSDRLEWPLQQSREPPPPQAAVRTG